MVCPHCRADNDDGDDFCIACDLPIRALPAQRQGARFQVYRGSVLPPYCVKCGEPVETERKPQPFYWHEPALYLLIFLGVVVYAIVAMVVRKRFDLAVPMCDAHLARRRKLRWSSLVAFVGAVVFAIVAMTSGNKSLEPLGCVVAALGTITSIVLILIAERTIRPMKITESTAEFAGASEAFLRRLG